MKKEEKNKINFGVDFDLENDELILQINSPEEQLQGPYVVVYKNIPEKWAIVAYDWNGHPNLGIRWFWDTNGNPTSTGYPTWLVIPSMLTNAVLNGLPLEFKFRNKLNRFLADEIKGEELKEKGGEQ